MGAYTEIVDFTFTANETSRTFSGLSITKDDFIKVVFTGINPQGTNSDIRLLGNSSTNTNYHNQILQSTGTTVEANRVNLNRFTRIRANNTGNNISYLKLSQNNRLNIFTHRTQRNDSTLENDFEYMTSSGATFANGITSLTLEAAVTNAIGTGSRIQIYRLDAEKIADITVTSNTTQVDISNLSIDKDSEYLLVSDALNATTTTTRLNLFINDNTTANQYFHQTVQAFGSSAGAGRQNLAGYFKIFANNFSPTPISNIGYAHIKLSNIGAYTYQAYNQLKGNTSIDLFNAFGSSTAENITSITKLNIKAQSGTNPIAAGSRFILYKLYE